MIRFSKLAAAVSVLPVFVALTPLASATGYGQIEQGDIYRVKDVTTNSAFADNISVACGDTVAFRVRIHNGGPETLTNIKVSATLNGASSTSHGSQVSLSADNNLHNMKVTANAGANTAQATTATYVSGSTQLLNYSTTPGGESVLKNLPDGILSGGINIGSIGPLTADTEEVQFQAKVSCPTPPPQVSFACKGADVKQIDRTHFDFTAYAEVQNATVNSYVFTVKDASNKVVDTQTVNTSALSAVYHFNQSKVGTYTVTAVIHTNQGTTEVGKCEAGIAVTSTPPVTPPETPSTTTLPNTGPGGVVALFAGVSALGTAGHYVVSRRRQS
jgi:uncharacterized repeat protein (TIGR01451 family)